MSFFVLRARLSQCLRSGPYIPSRPFTSTLRLSQLQSESPILRPPNDASSTHSSRSQSDSESNSHSSSDSNSGPQSQSPYSRFAKAFLLTLIPVTPIVIVFREHVVSTYPVGGPSMAPYLNATYGVEDLARETVAVSKLFWLNGLRQGKEGGVGDENWKGLHRGMVVMFRSPRNPEVLAIKRIIGLPGDEVTPRPSSSPTVTSYSSHFPDFVHPTHPQIVPYNHVWVEGDANDTSKSLDSNTYGPISMSLITGRVVGVIWPWERRRWLRWQLWDPDVEQASGGKQRLYRELGEVDEAERERERGGETGKSQRSRVKKGVISVEAPFGA